MQAFTISAHQIVLLVTKAVGDFLGTNGIADEMIRFNGYPFLEKEDHAFNVPVSSVMKRDLYTLPASGICVRDLEDKIASTEVRGFPIISSDSLPTLQGYVGRTELCYVLGKPLHTRRKSGVDHGADNARELRDISQDTPCSFIPDTTDQGVPGLPDGTHGPAISIEEDVAEEIIGTTVSSEVLKFWPWVNQVFQKKTVGFVTMSLTMHSEDTSHSVPPASLRNSHATV